MTCEFPRQKWSDKLDWNNIITRISENNTLEFTIQNYHKNWRNNPRWQIDYNLSTEKLVNLIKNSGHCYQEIRYNW